MDQFEITFYYNQPVEEVFRYWATGEGLEAFFIEKARCRAADGLERSPDEAELAGDSYRWEWRQPFDAEGEVLRVTPGDQIAFTFGSMKVAVLFTEVDSQTELRLKLRSRQRYCGIIVYTYPPFTGHQLPLTTK